MTSYRWFCKCGKGNFGECGPIDKFCWISCCFRCGATNIPAIHTEVYSLWEKFIAWCQGKILISATYPSITPEEDELIFKKEHPEIWKKEHPNDQ